MAFRWQAGVMGLAVLTGMALPGCASSRKQQAVPVTHHTAGHRADSDLGYGGSGEAAAANEAANNEVPGVIPGTEKSATVNLEAARQECQRVARDVKRYSRVIPGRAYVTGASTATVQLYVGRPYTNIAVDCTYNAQTGSAEVPPK
jgi:hypothetical protein